MSSSLKKLAIQVLLVIAVLPIVFFITFQRINSTRDQQLQPSDQEEDGGFSLNPTVLVAVGACVFGLGAIAFERRRKIAARERELASEVPLEAPPPVIDAYQYQAQGPDGTPMLAGAPGVALPPDQGVQTGVPAGQIPTHDPATGAPVAYPQAPGQAVLPTEGAQMYGGHPYPGGYVVLPAGAVQGAVSSSVPQGAVPASGSHGLYPPGMAPAGAGWQVAPLPAAVQGEQIHPAPPPGLGEGWSTASIPGGDPGPGQAEPAAPYRYPVGPPSTAPVRFPVDPGSETPPAAAPDAVGPARRRARRSAPGPVPGSPASAPGSSPEPSSEPSPGPSPEPTWTSVLRESSEGRPVSEAGTHHVMPDPGAAPDNAAGGQVPPPWVTDPDSD